MRDSFEKYVNDLEPFFQRLVGMAPVTIGQLKPPLPERCVYLFSESGLPLYVGRTNHLSKRVKQHSAAWAQHNQAVFAFRLARHETGKVLPGYTKETARATLLSDPVFSAAFVHAKERIRSMQLRFVPVDDPLRQALLEIYVAVVLETPHNDFETH